MMTSEPVPGKLYVWKWGERGIYQTECPKFDTRLVSMNKGDVFFLLEHSEHQAGIFQEVVLKVFAGETCGWVLFDRFYADKPNERRLMEEYTEPSS